MANKKKAPFKRRASSPAKDVRPSRRLRTQSLKSRLANSAIPSQDRSALLSLPREVRDQIYVEILEGLPLTFRLGKLYITVIGTQNREADINSVWQLHRGLLLWMLSSQQILYEALGMIARTYTFQPFGRLGYLEAELPGKPNSLVFTDGGVQNIMMYPEVSDYTFFKRRDTSIRGDLSVPFLKVMNSVHIKDACLELIWQWDNERSREDTATFVSEWGEIWTGRFLKVTIEIWDVSTYNTGGISLWILEEAEKCAARLVGIDGTISWVSLGLLYKERRFSLSPYSGHRQQVWVRRVTFERKV